MECCQELLAQTLDKNARVTEVAQNSPDCACEKYRTSQYSPGPVEDCEKLGKICVLANARRQEWD